MPENTNKLESIQALRGLAAMLVVMFHFRTDLASYFPLASWIFAQGAIGVDLFFMISGFIVYYVTVNESGGLKSSTVFFTKRLCRIVPPYVIATIFIAGNSWDKWYLALHAFTFLPADITQPAPFFGYPRLFVGWSLNYEFVFYSICSFSLIFRKYKYFIITLIISCSVLFPFITHGYGFLLPKINYGYHGYLALITNGMMLEFLAGLIVGYIAINFRLYYSRIVGRAAVSLAALYFTYIALSFGSNPGNGNYDFFSASFFLILTLTSYEYQYGIKAPKLLISIGTLSFSVYLMHPHGLSIARKIIARHYHGLHSGLIAFLLALTLTVLFSLIFYKLFETNLCNLIRNKLIAKCNKQALL
ncbi:acyltransferase [Pantoea sp. Bo_2]|uniref:Acyltransferase n=1 Tax=Candidatus Pantoea gossypiicola TaxID=2608008 RepID=A0AB34CDQ3_9GAMM|nr:MULTISPECIES: acyltransferase [Pantoea]KAA5920580.1 acyltransferase [Pantoea sp. VH_8]KAA5927316.1 acyltransferase [Pantoea sp. VH_4]KAA5934643.1 acyltransferase [Pantoea sp. VH_3]KAA5943971.1 acyltransferase [Pantoea sp. VH_25]KAA5956672.1 acyltransferase [Pantoea sp. VH_24]